MGEGNQLSANVPGNKRKSNNMKCQEKCGAMVIKVGRSWYNCLEKNLVVSNKIKDTHTVFIPRNMALDKVLCAYIKKKVQ